MPPSWPLGHRRIHPPTLCHGVSPQVHPQCSAPCRGEGELYFVNPQQKSRMNRIKDVPPIPTKGSHLVVPQKLLLGEHLLGQFIWVCSDPSWHHKVYAGIYVEAQLDCVLRGLYASPLCDLPKLCQCVILQGTHHLLKGALSMPLSRPPHQVLTPHGRVWEVRILFFGGLQGLLSAPSTRVLPCILQGLVCGGGKGRIIMRALALLGSLGFSIGAPSTPSTSASPCRLCRRLGVDSAQIMALGSL